VTLSVVNELAMGDDRASKVEAVKMPLQPKGHNQMRIPAHPNHPNHEGLANAATPSFSSTSPHLAINLSSKIDPKSHRRSLGT
jgi:hypothetical protein